MAASITVYFNPRCSKCRQAVALLDERGQPYSLRRYLEAPPDRTELDRLLLWLGGGDPRIMVRTKEQAYRDLGLAGASADDLLDAIVEHPELLERPIVVRDGRAVVARPPEELLRLL